MSEAPVGPHAHTSNVIQQGVDHAKQTGGNGKLTRGLSASRTIANFDRAVGGWRPHRRLGGHLRMVVLRRAPGRWGEAGRDVHEQGHRRAAEAVVAAASAEPRSSGRATLRKARALSTG